MILQLEKRDRLVKDIIIWILKIQNLVKNQVLELVNIQDIQEMHPKVMSLDQRNKPKLWERLLLRKIENLHLDQTLQNVKL